MKCPRCHKEMTRKKAKSNYYYYECNSCHHNIGKPKPEEENLGGETNEKENE